MPDFPLVPNAPGVPAVFRNASNSALATPSALTSDGAGVGSGASQTPQWGIADDGGTMVIEPDSVVALDNFRHEFKVSDFPIEGGGFASYNKVARPFEGAFIFNKGGDQGKRTTFLDSLETIVADVKLYTFVTPEKSYPNVNLESYSIRARSSERGFQLITVDLRLVEVRVAAAAAFSNTSDPGSQNAQNDGAVQAQTPSASQTATAQTGAAGAQGVGTVTPGP